jgi:hypothetical protein
LVSLEGSTPENQSIAKRREPQVSEKNDGFPIRAIRKTVHMIKMPINIA